MDICTQTAGARARSPYDTYETTNEANPHFQYDRCPFWPRASRTESMHPPSCLAAGRPTGPQVDEAMQRCPPPPPPLPHSDATIPRFPAGYSLTWPGNKVARPSRQCLAAFASRACCSWRHFSPVPPVPPVPWALRPRPRTGPCRAAGPRRARRGRRSARPRCRRRRRGRTGR